MDIRNPVARLPAARAGAVPLAVLATAQFLVVLDTSIVNVALASIRSGLGMSSAALSWVVDAYLLAFGTLLLPSGRAADRFGRRRVLLTGLAVFALASLAAGLAPSAAALIAARAAQGVGAALLAPAALSLVLVLYPEGPARSTALGVWGAVSGAGGAAGVLLGGVLTQTFGWPAVFLATVPVAVALLVAVPRLIPPDAARSARARSDLPGTLTVTAALVTLTYGLSTGGRTGWTSPVIVGTLTAAPVLLGAFWWIEHRSPDPLLPPRLLRAVGTPLLVMLLLGAAWVGLFYHLPLYQQQVLGYGPLTAGLAQLPLAAAITLASALAPRPARRYGSRATLVTALVLLAGGLAWLSRAGTGAEFLTGILGPSVLIGAGLGGAFVQLTAAATRGVTGRDAGLAGGLVNTTRQVGGALGLAVLTAVATARTDRLAAHASARQALVAGHRAAFLAAALLAALAALLARTTVPRGPAEN
ncbi:MFS transporter [Actinoallomurus rhizosphaericola]|uniref:MFS transporter n=1 Tax=Actinoallomurus rhizosphaericola TaxID=2952536 RepID=UPI002092D68A|nr:MFS transporter [Actinoallomurus rhizosphaericola]MCO6000218.1 MFS transporter [Actinoallomurus rhizosphaericola]